MRLEDLKGYKKSDKLELLKKFVDNGEEIDSLGEEVITKFSTDAIDVREYIAKYTRNHEIILSMLYDEKKTWKKESILHKIMNNPVFTMEDRLELIKSRIWEEFPANLSNGWFILKPLRDGDKNKSYTELIVKMLEDKPLPTSFIEVAFISATEQQIIKLIELNEVTDLAFVFNDKTMLDRISIENIRELAIKKLSKTTDFNRYWNDYFFFNTVLDDRLFKHLFSMDSAFGDGSFETLSSEAKAAIFKNSNLKKAHIMIFNDYLDKKPKDYDWTVNKLLPIVTLNAAMHKSILEELSYSIENNNMWVEKFVYNYLKNPTADKKTAKKIIDTVFKLSERKHRKDYNRYTLDNSKIAGLVSSNNLFNDKETEKFIEDAIEFNNRPTHNMNLPDPDDDIEGTLITFKEMLDVVNAQIPDKMVKKVWRIIKNEKHTSKNIHITAYTHTEELAFYAFFSTSTISFSVEDKSIIDSDYQRKCAIEYFELHKIPDWINYTDSLSETLLDKIWESEYIQAIEKINTGTYNTKIEQLKIDIMSGKYIGKYALKFYEETGNMDFLPDDAKEMFLF